MKGTIQNLLTADYRNIRVNRSNRPPPWILSNGLQISMSQHWFSVIICAKSPAPLMASDKPNYFHWRAEQITAAVSELTKAPRGTEPRGSKLFLLGVYSTVCTFSFGSIILSHERHGQQLGIYLWNVMLIYKFSCSENDEHVNFFLLNDLMWQLFLSLMLWSCFFRHSSTHNITSSDGLNLHQRWFKAGASGIIFHCKSLFVRPCITLPKLSHKIMYVMGQNRLAVDY